MSFIPLLIILSGLMDRIRGDAMHFFSRMIDKIIYGWVLSALFMHPFDWLTPLIIVGFVLGMSPGWGDSSGAILERREMYPEKRNWWQVGFIKKSKFASAVTRGLMWGLPVSLLGYFDFALFAAAPIFVVAYVGSAYLAGIKLFKSSWEYMESFRGLIAGALIAALMYFINN